MQGQFYSKVRINVMDWLFIAVCCCNMGIFLFSSDMFYNFGLFSLSARLFIILNILTFILTMFRPTDKYQTWQVLIMIFMAFFMVTSYVIRPAGSLYDFVIALTGYIAVPIYALAVQRVSFSDTMIKVLRVVSVIYAALFIYRGYFARTYRPNSDALTLGYTNPNTTGAYMFLICLFVLLAFDNVEKKVWRYFSYCLVALMLYPILLTQCRAAFFLTMICYVYAVFPKIYRPQKVFPAVCVVFPWFFYYLYIYLYKIGWNVDAMLLDKTIYSGRQETFLSENIVYTLLGYFSKGFAGLNSAVGVINTLGIIGFVLYAAFYICFLTAPFMQSYIGKRVNKRNLPLVCMSALMLYGCVESMMFTAGTVFAGMIGCILAVIACNHKENYKELAMRYGY